MKKDLWKLHDSTYMLLNWFKILSSNIGFIGSEPLDTDI
jgi:hypothetical protein